MTKKGIYRKIKQSKFPYQMKLIDIATVAVDQWHYKTPKRMSGEPFGNHPRAVIAFLLELWPLPPYVYYAAAAHDAREYKNCAYDVKTIIGTQAMQLVEGMTEDTGYRRLRREEEAKYWARKQRYHKKFEQYFEKDPYIIILKFADLMHNLKTLRYLPEKRQLRYIREARYFLAFYRNNRNEVKRLLPTSKQLKKADAWHDLMTNIVVRKYHKLVLKCGLNKP